MLNATQVEYLIETISRMDRDRLVSTLLEYRASFPVDFSAEYLRGQSLDRIRHILVALCLHCGKLPESDRTAAA